MPSDANNEKAAVSEISRTISIDITNSNNNPPDRNRISKEKQRDWLDYVTVGVLVATFGAALYAGIEAGRLANLTQAMIIHGDNTADIQHKDTLSALSKADDANTISANALTTVQRAFVFAKSFNNVLYGNSDSLGIQVMWQNSGNTPTKDLEIYTMGCINTSSNPLITKGFKFPVVDINCTSVDAAPIPESLLGPKATMVSKSFDFLPKMMELVNSGKHANIWGWARYNDVFEKTPRHLTRFCIELIHFSGNINTPDQTSTATYIPCDYGNCADDECTAQGLP
jgi:hypothetical protein